MAVPNQPFSRAGIYFAQIEDYSGPFEKAIQEGPYSYKRAVSVSGLLNHVTNVPNGSYTDCYTYAYMPANTTASWIVQDKNYFSSEYTYSWTSGRVGGTKLRHTRYSGSSIIEDYPVTIAKRGYRTLTTDSAPASIGVYDDGSTVRVRTWYDFFNTEQLDVTNENDEEVQINLSTSSYSTYRGEVQDFSCSGSWGKGSCQWIGLALQAGGEAGADKTGYGNGGSGGTCGGFWFGLLKLSAGNWVITISNYTATSGSKAGSSIEVTCDGVTLLQVNGGEGGEGKVSTSTSPNLISFRYANGVGGGGGGKNGKSVSVTDWVAQTPDQKGIAFVSIKAGEGATGGGGGGASSIRAMGGFGGGHKWWDWNGYGADGAFGYGAGGGGASYSMLWWETKKGSAGGKANVIIGY